jgi:hypothetical protein
MAISLEPRHRQRRGLLLRYIHHVERTGLSLHPALEMQLSSFQEARAADTADPLAEPATAIAPLEPEGESCLARPGSTAPAPALPVAPPSFDPPVGTASASGPVITVKTDQQPRRARSARRTDAAHRGHSGRGPGIERIAAPGGHWHGADPWPKHHPTGNEPRP